MNSEQKKEKVFEIIVNTRPKEVTGDEISYENIVKLAYPDLAGKPNTRFTITYRRGHGNKPEGSLAPGGTVKLKDGMIFNVTPTDKS